MANRSEKLRDALANPERKREYNRQLFRTVAPRYDLATRCLSLGRDAVWKRRLLANLPDLPAPVCVDLATGTGDLALGLASRYPSGRVLAFDLSPEMIERAKDRDTSKRVDFRIGDMQAIPCADGSVDILTGGYAWRNAPDPQAALREWHRVLAPGGVVALIEFAKPANRALAAMELFLLRVWGGFWGFLLHGDPTVYAYIAHSLALFPDRAELSRRIEGCGFGVPRSEKGFFGITELITFRKP